MPCETFFTMIEYIHPSDSLETVAKNIEKSEALWLEECYPGPLEQTTDFHVKKFEELIIDNPNKIFFFNNCPEFSNGITPSNVIWLPITTIRRAWQMKRYQIEQASHQVNFYSPRPKNLVYIGGKSRINRTLVNFWLGSNVDKNLLLYQNKGNNNLRKFEQLIKSSAYRYKLHPRKQLGDNWVEKSKDIGVNEFFVKFLLPKYFEQSNVALVTEANDYELFSGLTEKTFHAFYSGCFPLWLGNYKIDFYLKKLGFEMYDFLDYSHLHTTNRVDLTLLGLENNKNIFSDNNILNDLRSQYQQLLKYNHNLILQPEQWLQQFRNEFVLFLKFVKYREKHIDTIEESFVYTRIQPKYYAFILNYFDNV